MGQLARAFDTLFPGYEQLREDARADIRPTGIEPDLIVDVPYYQQTVEPPVLMNEKPFVTKSGRELGYRALYHVVVDGIGYEAFTCVPYDELRSDNEFLDLSSTAWMTQAGRGYTEDPNAKIFAHTLMPQVEIGPPASDSNGGLRSQALKLPTTLRRSKALPLSYTAQAEQAIVASLRENHSYLDLPYAQVKRGKSRGANLSSGHIPYARANGSEIIALMNMGRCAPDKIELADVPEFATWLTTTGLGGVAASACLLKDGKLGSLRGTTSLDLNFLTANLTGTMRALASGETGEMLEWTPRTMYGSEVLYGLDSLSKAEETKRRLADRGNMRKKIVKGGTHGALLHPLAHSGEIERMKRFAEQYRFYGGQLALMDSDYIYGVEELSLIEEAVA
jgi:hypothetical protein